MYRNIEEKKHLQEKINELEEKKKKLENDINEIYKLFYDIINEVYN